MVRAFSCALIHPLSTEPKNNKISWKQTQNVVFISTEKLMMDSKFHLLISDRCMGRSAQEPVFIINYVKTTCRLAFPSDLLIFIVLFTCGDEGYGVITL